MKLKVLQVIVGILGAAILVGLGLVGYGLALNADRLAQKGETVHFNAVTLGQPVGTEITHMAAVGGHVVLALRGGNLPPRILVLDPSTGAVAGTVTLTQP